MVYSTAIIIIITIALITITVTTTTTTGTTRLRQQVFYLLTSSRFIYTTSTCSVSSISTTHKNISQHNRAPRNSSKVSAMHARESFLRYQLPLPRVSAFLPQGFDWALQRHDEDDEDDEDDDEEEEDDDDDDDEEDNIRVFLKTSFQDSPPISSESKMNHHPGSSNANEIKNESIERQGGSWSQERDSMPTTDLLNSSISSPVWPAAGTMEPAKAAAIDMWRRSLLSPLLMDEASSLLSDDDDSDDDFGPHHALHGGQMLQINTAITGDLGHDFATRAQLKNTDDRGPISPQSAQSRSKWFSQKEPYIRPRLAMEDSLASSSSASSSGDQQCGPFVPIHRRQYQTTQQPYLQPSGRIEDNMFAGTAHHNRHISLGGLEIVTSGLGIHPHEQSQQHDMHRIAVDEEDDVPAPEPLHAVRFQQRWQKTQLSSDDETGTNRDSSMALTNTPDLNRSSFGTFPNRDSLMNLNNSSHLLSEEPSASSKKTPLPPAISTATTRVPPNKQAKKGILTGILKRPSLPDLGSAVLAAAVAGLGGAFSSETKKRTATFVTESTVVPQPQQWPASPTTPSSSQPGSSLHLPLYDPAYVFPAPQEIILPVPVLANEQRQHRRVEAVGLLSLPSPGLAMTSELNKGPFGLPMPRLAVAPPMDAVPAQLSPPARPPRRHPLDIRFLRKPSLATQSGRSAASGSSDQACEPQLAPLAAAPALSWTGPLSSVKPEDPLSTQETPVVVKTMLPRPPHDIPRRSSEPGVAFLGLGLDLGEDSFGEDIHRDLELTSQQSFTPPPPPTIPFMSSELRISPFDVVPGTPVEAFYDLAPDQFESPKQTEKDKTTETEMTEAERTELWQPRPPSNYQQPYPCQFQHPEPMQQQEEQQSLKELSPDKGSDQGPTFVPLRRSSSSTSCSKNDVLEFREEIDCVSEASAADDFFSYF
ncbi:hypothetical protein BGZ72_003667 [Mortierella alpina]|nr:hypothetical protein BGZ72_003667 [Mortierella alpina]